MNTNPDPAAWREAALGAAFGVALTLAAFWPGLMSVDSAVQFAQARGALPLDDVHPPLMALLWRAADRLWAGSGALFALFVTGWWIGLAALLWQGLASRGWRWGALLLIGFWPASWLMLGHVWKDIGQAAALLLAAAAILAWRRRGRRRWLLAAAVALLLASGFRHNGLFAALPLLAWALWPPPGETGRIAGRLLLGTLLVVVLALAPLALLRLSGAARVQPWSVVAQWDLAALSLAADAVLLPPGLRADDLSVAELRAAYVPWANPPLFERGRLRLSFYRPLDGAERRALRRAWWDAVRADPLAYLAHRARLARYLLFGFPSALPRELVYVPERRVLGPVDWSAPPVDAAAPLWRIAEALRPTPLFAGALYLLLAAVAAGRAWRGPDPQRRAAVWALAASAWAQALPLLLLAGSAEFRYLVWSALAALLATALAFGPPRRSGSIAAPR